MYKLVTPNCPDGFLFASLEALLYFILCSHTASFKEFIRMYKRELFSYLSDIIK